MVLATHLGLRPTERRTQVRRLLDALPNNEESGATVLMGDLNDWFLWGRPLRWLNRHFRRSSSPASYPACCPFFALDRIWAKPHGNLRNVKVINTELTRAASDHLPLVATLE